MVDLLLAAHEDYGNRYLLLLFGSFYLILHCRNGTYKILLVCKKTIYVMSSIRKYCTVLRNQGPERYQIQERALGHEPPEYSLRFILN